MCDILVIGAGPAGLTAALYGVRYGLSVTVFEKLYSGGQLTTTPMVENYPGVERIAGFEFAMNLHNQAVNLGVKMVTEEVVDVSLEGEEKRVVTDKGKYVGKTIIIANGATRRKLGCIGEEEFSGRGVSYCATCDGAFFKNKEVAIVGGGNTALEDALFLSQICTKVNLIHRKNEFRGMEVLQEAVKKRSNIQCIMNAEIESILGNQEVETIRVKAQDSELYSLQVSGVFVAVGTKPDNEFLNGKIPLDEGGYIKADETCKTLWEGVFVAGDTRTKTLRQIVTATSDGAIAAFYAANYINHI